MEGLAVVGVVFVLIVVGCFGVSAVLRRIPAPSLRLPTGPIPDTWHGIVEHNVPLARGLSSDERERLLRLVQVFLKDKHFEGCGGLTLTEEMKVTNAAEACLLLLHLEGPCYPVDGDNVALHEFAHQLDAEDGFSDGAPILSPNALRTWGEIGRAHV